MNLHIMILSCFSMWYNFYSLNLLTNFRPRQLGGRILGPVISADSLLGRWRLCLELFGRVFLEDVGAEPGSVLSELRGFEVKETRFRREMEKLRNSQKNGDISLEVRYTGWVKIMSFCHMRRQVKEKYF